jgi:8-oxo-dGTP diphosphatase
MAGHRNVCTVIFYTDDGKLLLQDREGIAKFGEEYDFFGGGIEEDETPEEALARELKEEIDYVCANLKLYKVYEFKIDEHNSRTEYTFFAKAPRLEEIKVLEGKKAVFMTLKEALSYKLFPHDDVIIKEFGKEKGFL